MEPCKPVAPSKPVAPEPVAPSKPVDPCKPVAPSKPVAPEPVAPCKPVAPLKPVAPKPVAPSKPVEPWKPVAPSNPVAPEPVAPCNPARPTIVTENSSSSFGVIPLVANSSTSNFSNPNSFGRTDVTLKILNVPESFVETNFIILSGLTYDSRYEPNSIIG